ncbi:MAG TPA: hypothetical protein VGB85_25235 [Nannocystis sp.]
MKLRTSLLLTLTALTLGLASTDAAASNYPPDYDVCSATETRYSGPFEVIRDFVDLYDDHMKLTVAYDGYLRDLYADDQINIYIVLNGNDAFIEALPGTHDDAYIFLDSGPRGCHWCGNGWNPPGTCDGVVFNQYESGKWICGTPTAVEDHLFEWAFNGYGQLNAWDIELAAEAGGQWDSNFGANFDVRFEPRGCY